MHQVLPPPPRFSRFAIKAKDLSKGRGRGRDLAPTRNQEVGAKGRLRMELEVLRTSSWSGLQMF